MPKKPSKAKVKALRVVSNHAGAITAKEFAKKMWPDSIGWQKQVRAGRGVAKGKCMWTKGGQYLHYLEREGLVGFGACSKYIFSFHITVKGVALLKEVEGV